MKNLIKYCSLLLVLCAFFPILVISAIISFIRGTKTEKENRYTFLYDPIMKRTSVFIVKKNKAKSLFTGYEKPIKKK